MEISIVGLGLMGGSLAFALKGFRDCRITGFDPDRGVQQSALETGAVHQIADSLEDAFAKADIAAFCSSPATILANMKTGFTHLKDGAVMTDICGVKEPVLKFIAENLPERLEYVGIHPMAGKEVGGFANADPTIYRNAGFIVIPPDKCDEGSVELICEMCNWAGAGRIVVNSAEAHDRIIAYSSDLMHISAAALCAAHPEDITMAHTAGAFRDSTRVADIDAALWTELLCGNSTNVLPWLDLYIEKLTGFKDALAVGNRDYIRDFLQKSRDNKKNIGRL